MVVNKNTNKGELFVHNVNFILSFTHVVNILYIYIYGTNIISAPGQIFLEIFRNLLIRFIENILQ